MIEDLKFKIREWNIKRIKDTIKNLNITKKELFDD